MTAGPAITSTPRALLAVDVDGTLVGPDGVVAPELNRAIQRVRQSGVAVCLATGRSYVETIDVWRQLQLPAPHEPIILVGGALVSEPAGRRSLYHQPMDLHLADGFARTLGEAGYSAMALMDSWRYGVEYYVTLSRDEPAARRLLERMNVEVRYVDRLAGADIPEPLRVTALVDPADGEALAGRLQQRFGDQLELHAIRAPNYGVTVIEAFAAGASKASALKYVAQGYRLAASKVVAVGDDVNDIPMLRWAGAGLAMPAAAPAVREAADAVVEGRLAEVIDRLADGQSPQGLIASTSTAPRP